MAVVPVALAAFWLAPEIGVAVPYVIGAIVAAGVAIAGFASLRNKDSPVPKHAEVRHDPAVDGGSAHYDMASAVVVGISEKRPDLGAVAFPNATGYNIAFSGIQGEDWGVTQYLFEDAPSENGKKQYLIVWGKNGTITYKQIAVSTEPLATSNVKISQTGTGGADDHTLWFPGSEQQ